VVDVDEFIRNGFVKVTGPDHREKADAACDLLWKEMGLSPDEPGSWLEPVTWAADVTGHGPFGELARSAHLADALDRVAGPGGWVPRGALGNIPIRFPLPPTVDDRGWHIDANTRRRDGSWGVSGRPRTLLLLTLLSDVGPDDAPTRIRIGSHRDVAAVLPAEAVTFEQAGRLVEAATSGREVAHATGEPGDMYLVHPFTAHAAVEHRGVRPRFMAQTPVALTGAVTPGSESPLARVWD